MTNDQNLTADLQLPCGNICPPVTMSFGTDNGGSNVWIFEFGSRAAQALAPRVGTYLKFGFWCLEFS